MPAPTAHEMTARNRRASAYGHAAALLASAQALAAATHRSGSVAAAPATLACLETSLDALWLAVARLRAHARRSIASVAGELAGA